MESRAESEERFQKSLEEVRRNETEEMKARYGQLPLMQSTSRGTDNRIDIDTITDEMAGQEVVFRCRLHHTRAMGAKLVFLIFRQQISTIQGVLNEEPDAISMAMLHWAERLRTGNVMKVRGIVQKAQTPIKSTSIHNVEIKITELKVIVRRAEPGPYLQVVCLLERLINHSALFCSRSRAHNPR